jgi:hypothetical protein
MALTTCEEFPLHCHSGPCGFAADMNRLPLLKSSKTTQPREAVLPKARWSELTLRGPGQRHAARESVGVLRQDEALLD